MNITVGGARQPVLLRKYEYLREYWPSPTATGTPVFYADYDYTNWLIAPTPDVAYAFEVWLAGGINKLRLPAVAVTCMIRAAKSVLDVLW